MPATVFFDQSLSPEPRWPALLAASGLRTVPSLPEHLGEAVHGIDPAVAVVADAHTATEVRHANPGVLILFLANSTAPTVADASLSPSAGDASIVAVVRALARAAEAESRAEALAEPARDLANARLAAIIESSDDAIISKGLDGIITSWNSGAHRLFGFTEDEAIGRHIALIIPQELWEEEAQLLARLRKGERIDHYHTTRRSKDGRPIDISLTISPIRDHTGTIVGVSKVARDIGVSRRAAEVGDRLAAIVESSDDAIISKSLDGVIRSWNSGAERIFGYTAAEAIGKHIYMLIPDERRPEEDEILSRLRKGERIDHFETVRRAKDGHLIDVSITVSPVRDGSGRIVGASKVARDITQHRLAQERTKTSEAAERARALELAAVMNAAPAIVMMTSDPRCRTITGNRAAYDALHLPEGANIALSTPAPGRLGPLRVFRDGQELPDPQLPLRRAAAGEVIRDEELEIRFESAPSLWVYGHATPIRTESGELSGAVGVFVDVSELKKTREQLSDRVRDLARSNAELQDFAYVASHDLKEPLRGIATSAQFLIEDYGQKLDEEGREKLRTLVRLPKRMYGLLDALLDYARLGRDQVRLEEIDAAVAVEGAIDTLRSALDAAGAQVVVEQPLPRVRADRVLLTQVFTNLIANAVKYNTDPHPRVEIGSAGGALYVRDNGIGISPRHYESIFRMFRRLHAREAYGGGTGVGLAIVKKIVELHGGRVSIDSQEGRGSAFFIHLPPVSPAGAPSPKREALAHS